MTNFLSQWWWAVLGVLCLFIPVIYNEVQIRIRNEIHEYNPGIILGCVLLFGIIAPQFYFDELFSIFGEGPVTTMYFFYLGVLFVLSYYYPKRTFLLRMLAALNYLIIWPKTEKGNLYIGIFLIALSPLALVTK